MNEQQTDVLWMFFDPILKFADKFQASVANGDMNGGRQMKNSFNNLRHDIFFSSSSW